MKNLSSLLLILVLVAGMAISGCKKEDPPPPPNEEELITTVKITLVRAAGGATFEYFWRDLDGEGGNPPSQIDTIELTDNATYTGTIEFLNETETPPEDVTEEIKDEGDEHLVCYEVLGMLSFGAQIQRQDSVAGLPLGLETIWGIADAKEGEVVITLKHQPGVKDGSCDPGETDIEVTFPTKEI